MRSRGWTLASLLLVVYAVFTGFAAGTMAPGVAYGEFAPAGLAAVALIVTDRRTWPALVPVLWLAGTAAYLVAGLGLGAGSTRSTALTLGAVVVALLMGGSTAERPTLSTGDGYRRYLVASTSGAVVGALVVAAVSVPLFDAPLRLVLLATFLSQFCGHVLALPFFMEPIRHTGVAGTLERLVCWGALVGALGISFVMSGPLTQFTVVGLIPVLGWGAMRLTGRDSMLQLLTVAVVTDAMTMRGRGAFVSLADVGLEAWTLPASQFFLAVCALSSVPLSLTVGLHKQLMRFASAEAETVRRVVDSTTGVAIIGTDARGRINIFNPGAEKMLQYRAEEVLGQTPEMFVSEGEAARLAVEIGVPPDFWTVIRTLAEPERAGFEMEFTRSDGSRRIHFMTLSTLVDAAGEVSGFVSTGEDVTDRVLTQRALELALHSERAAVERLREVDQVKDTFVSSVSHELRTPITSIMGYLEVLSDGGFGELSASQRSAVTRIDLNSKRLLLLIDDLLVLSRVQDRGLGRVDEEFDLRESVRAAYDVVAPAAEAAGVELVADLPAEPSWFTGDRDQMERVLINLVGNGVKFSPDGGVVTTRLESGPGGHALSVTDTGVGIPVEEQAALFTRFFRSSIARDRAIQGSGLGLSIAKAIVERHDGTISVASVPGRGTDFLIRLPQAQPQQGSGTRTEALPLW